MAFFKERPKVDYSRFLGPDWKPKYDGAGIYVANHTCHAEILMNFFLLNPAPAYLSKAKNKSIPGIGFIMRSIKCLFIENRGKSGSKEQKLKVI